MCDPAVVSTPDQYKRWSGQISRIRLLSRCHQASLSSCCSARIKQRDSQARKEELRQGRAASRRKLATEISIHGDHLGLYSRCENTHRAARQTCQEFLTGRVAVLHLHPHVRVALRVRREARRVILVFLQHQCLRSVKPVGSSALLTYSISFWKAFLTRHVGVTSALRRPGRLSVCART